jgi:hypothetical protein
LGCFDRGQAVAERLANTAHVGEPLGIEKQRALPVYLVFNGSAQTETIYWLELIERAARLCACVRIKSHKNVVTQWHKMLVEWQQWKVSIVAMVTEICLLVVRMSKAAEKWTNSIVAWAFQTGGNP